MNIEEVWLQYRNSLKAFLLSRVSNPSEAEDLLQEVLIKTYDNLHTVKDAGSIKSWLFQIANNAIIDFYRKRAKSQNLDADDLWYEEDDEDIRQSLSTCITPFIKWLPEESAQLLTVVDLEGKSQKDYAKEIGVSYSTLKSRVQKARNQLRKLFEDCCHFSLDKSGNLIDFDLKSNTCDKC